MQVIRTRKMGFCFGVRRAYELVEKLAKENDERPLMISGPLVHNTKVIDRISGMGVAVSENAEEIKGARVVIRTHGTTKENYEKLLAQNEEVHDATCCIVNDVRYSALELLERHPVVIIVGKKKHPEIIGLISWLDGRYHVVEHPEDLESLPHYPSVGVVSQTTFAPGKFEQYCSALKERYPEVEVVDTICPHTSKNQDASRWTAKLVDVMLIVGDEHSSNSKTLYTECAKVNPRCYFIQGPDDIEEAWLAEVDSTAKPAPDKETASKGNARADYDPKKLAVGITAGASTPDWVIDAIEARLNEFSA
ncbi:4-hydroxy-3-methylbut-2-enyl diphosphate reductase [bacterium]|nr:4-hydroxy-3-methylbut-2-enyl diphosphate reductase [bacterium]